MNIKSDINEVERLPGGGWVGKHNPKKVKYRNPWDGMTPEEAYRKGVEDGKDDQQRQNWDLERLKSPLRC